VRLAALVVLACCNRPWASIPGYVRSFAVGERYLIVAPNAQGRIVRMTKAEGSVLVLASNEAALVTALQPRPTGQTPKPSKLQAADDMMMAAGEIIRSLRGLPPEGSRTSSPRSKRSPKTPPDGDDPEPEPSPAPTQKPTSMEEILRRALTHLTTRPHDSARAARALGVGMKTLRRWLSRLVDGTALIKRRGGRMRTGPASSEQRVRSLVVELHGLAGAQSLARSVAGVSRRRAAQLKHEVLMEMERTRQRACARVEVTVPGVIRGFDAMHLVPGFALNAADACVPYRTSSAYVTNYDAESVAAVLEQDFRTHSAPLVLRDDCASCHTAPAVMSVLDAYGVALLQGPPYHAQYYGQHERQNREHRDWLAWIERTSDDIQPELDRMKSALNERWLRPTLNWSSAAQVWQTRRRFDDERGSFLDEVHERAARLRGSGLDQRVGPAPCHRTGAHTERLSANHTRTKGAM